MNNTGWEPKICEEGGRGFLLPFDAENSLDNGLRAVVYIVVMLYCFLGVSIIADKFLAAIERITSSTTSTGVRVWNDTVANLTLMALGSSAPEILLNVIEVGKNEFYSGELGPSTIVGSASFNLFVIVAVCIAGLPDGQKRRIKDWEVFVVTAAFSIFAYFWLVVIVQLASPDVIEVWEGVLTFGFFGVLIVVAYATDKRNSKDPPSALERAQTTGSQGIVSQKPEAGLGPCVVDLGPGRGGTFDSNADAGEPSPTRSRSAPPSRSRSRIRQSNTRDWTGSRKLGDNTTNNRSNCGSQDTSCATITGMDNEETYQGQIKEAFWCNTSPEAAKNACWSDVALHAVSVPWKLFFAILTPPTNILGGWLCFVASLLHIGLVTAIIGDLAELFGCVVGLEDSITAITFVALGTSMPDLFASKAAAMQDKYADASIVNVTGSNSVNVFLGIGLPWMMASIYWAVSGATEEWRSIYSNHPGILEDYPNGAFVVLSSDLTFGVSVFAAGALIAFILLVMRRHFLGCELGGNYDAKVLSAILLVTLWVAYIALSVWKISSTSEDTIEQLIAVCIAGVALVLVMLAATASLKCAACLRKDGQAACGHKDGIAEEFPPEKKGAAGQCSESFSV